MSEGKPKTASFSLGSGVALQGAANDEGVWFELRTAPGVRVRLRHAENPDMKRAQQAASAEMARRWPGSLRAKHDENAPEEAVEFAEQRSAEDFATHVLMDWEGPTHPETGDPLEYTPELGAELMTDFRWKLVRKEVEGIAWGLSNFREKATKEVAESVGNSSSGSSSTERRRAPSGRKT
jgi:hypothetical protein